MANGKWNAIISNGYNNSTRNVGFRRGGGLASIIIVDIETGQRVRKIFSNTGRCRGNQANPNGMSEPTAVDLDGDNMVDRIYAADLYGCVHRYDVSNSNPRRWGRATLLHEAVDQNGDAVPITTSVVVGSHPTGNGVMIYFGTGKYLEPSDQVPSGSVHRIYGLWDKDDGSNTANLTKVSNGRLLEQYILSESLISIDTDDDGSDDSVLNVRTTSQETINWGNHHGWYMDLQFGSNYTGEQVIATPVLRDGKILFSTHVPMGNECTPDQQGWLMALDARDGSMLKDSAIDLNGDGKLNDEDVAGIQGLTNPFAPPTIVSGENLDYMLSQDAEGEAVTSTGLKASIADGRVTWREVEP